MRRDQQSKGLQELASIPYTCNTNFIARIVDLAWFHCILASFRRWRLMPELLYKSSTVNRVLSRCLPRSASRPMATVRYPRGSGGTKQDPRESNHSQVRHPQGWDRVNPHPNKAARCPLYPPSPALPPVPLFLLQGSAPAHLLVRCVMFLCREASVFSSYAFSYLQWLCL